MCRAEIMHSNACKGVDSFLLLILCLTADADIRVIPPEAVQAHAADLCSLDLMTATPEDVQSVKVFYRLPRL